MRVGDVRALARRAERERTGLFFAEGARAAALVFELGWTVEAVVSAPRAAGGAVAGWVLAEARSRGVPVLELPEETFATLVRGDERHPVGAVVRQRWTRLACARPGGGLCWLALDGVQYPGNLGTVLRTAEAVGAEGVVLLDRTADPYDPLAVRASLGALFGLPLARAGFGELVAWAAAHGARLVGTSPGAATDYRQGRYARPLVLVLGGERRGLAPEQLAACAEVVRIPMTGRGDSLNLAVAAGLLLYEAYRAAY
jgi:TrmH family RNA methyltransferase